MQYVKVRQGEWTYYIGKENWQSKRSVETEETSPKGKTRRTVGLTPFPAMLKSLGECEVVGEVLGSEMLGWAYDGPFDELPAQREMGGFPWPDPKLRSRCGASDHRVIAWDLVSGAEGTGLVHIAPGCGKEDYALGQSKGLVALAPLNEHGVFLPAFGPFAGSYAHDVGEAIAADLKRKGLLVAKEHYPHRYPHCWRCGTKTLFRLVDEWYIRMGWRQEIMYLVPQIRWIPDWGEKQELDWLSNMGDWMISKKRFWGLALPIWQCDRHSAPGAERCSWFDVIGSRDELRSRAAEGWAEFDGHSPHRPWVDKVKVRCPKCGGTASRIPDVGNPWLDAGIVPFSTQRYHADRAYWDQWYPADLVLECFPGQFRNWFYALLAMSTMMQEDRWADRNGGVSKVVPPFKALLGHALVRDEEGKEMHKSAGNAIEFNEAAASMGAEVMRYIFAAQNPENNLNFPDIRKDRRKDVLHLDQQVQRRLNSLWNCYSFYVLYASVDKIQPASLRASSPERSELDRWILSKLQGLIACARKSFEERRIYLFMGRFERFVDALSNWYLRRSRRRFWKSEADADKLAAYATLYECLETLVRLLSPVLPFLAEEIYQNLVRAVCPQAPGSVHLLAYPEADASRVDERLEKRIDAVVRYRDLALSIRSAANVKVRQPLARMLVRPESAEERDALSDASLRGQLLEEVNVRTLELLESAEGLVRARLKPDPKRLGERYGRWLKEIEEHLAATDAAAVQANLRVTGCYRFEAGPQTVELLADDVVVEHEAPAGIRFVFDGEAFAALDTELTPELKAEGTARDVVRGIQDLRKSIGLHVADRIRIRYRTDAETAVIIKDWAEYIRKETLALELLCDDSIAEGSVKLKAARSPIHVKLERCG
jgi:isoleucyl-tRNA synthetase